MTTVRVALPSEGLADRSYNIEIGRGLLDSIGERMAAMGLRGRCAVVTNPLVGGLYAGRVTQGLAKAGLDALVIEMPDGEEYKSLAEAERIYDRLIGERFERSSPVVALGGGVVGDLAGFVAATYLRGVPYVQVPTTVLAQVDSSIGGKTAVNHPRGKNLIGAFHQPVAVFIDPDVLATLDARETRGGMAEMVKHAAIMDADYFAFLEGRAPEVLSLGDAVIEAIERSCRIKAGVVSSDEREGGLRAILNFGHTFGHAVEAISGYGVMRHGEAVAVGMVLAARLSEEMGLSSAGTTRRIEGLLSALGLPLERPGLSAEEMLESMKLDKKVQGAMIRFVLIRAIGDVFVGPVDEGRVRAFLGRIFR